MPKNHPPVIPRERSDRGNLLHKPDCNETAGKDCHEPQAALAMTGTGTFGCRSFPRFHPACSAKTLPLVRAVTGAPVPSYAGKRPSDRRLGSGYAADGHRSFHRPLPLCLPEKPPFFLRHSLFVAPNIALFCPVVKWFIFN